VLEYKNIYQSSSQLQNLVQW